MECFGQVTFLCKPYAQNLTFLHVIDNPPIQINPPKNFPYVLRPTMMACGSFGTLRSPPRAQSFGALYLAAASPRMITTCTVHLTHTQATVMSTYLPFLRASATVSRSLPRHEVIPMPVTTTRLRPDASMAI